RTKGYCLRHKACFCRWRRSFLAACGCGATARYHTSARGSAGGSRSQHGPFDASPGDDPMQALSSPHGDRRRVRKRHRHSRIKKWIERNAPYVFLYTAGAIIALATTYWLIRDAELSTTQGESAS